MKLFIVESPSKCSYIQGYLGPEYKVKASVGHVREIPKKGLNIDIKNNFEPLYKVSTGKQSVVKELKSLAEKADEIILATDPDREGEAIAWHIYDLLSVKNQKKCTRITFSEIKKAPILKALNNKREIDDNWVQAAKARQVLDRLIGYKVSPVLWHTVGSGTSAGRVQSVALKIICERQKEIDAFNSTDFWYIEALLQGKSGDPFWSKVVTKAKDNRYIDDKLSKEDLEKIEKASFEVDNIERKEKYNKPYPPFDTTSLQATCSTLFGWGATRSQSIAQSLYENGKVTYIRTDSYNISSEAIDEVRDLIKKASSGEYLPSKLNVYSKKSGVAAQEAHECIRPTHIYEKGNDIGDPSEQKMYKLIRDRFIACQMTPMVVDTVAYHMKASSGHKLLSTGQTIKFDGWQKVYKYVSAKEELLPAVSEGDSLSLEESKRTKHQTQPPARYNDASLLKIMEKEGVGRPSTRANLIGMLQKKEYVEKQKGKGKGFVATPLGMKISDYLSPRFKDFFMDIKYTSDVEDDLVAIADGKKTFLEVVTAVYETLKDHIKDAKDMPTEKKESVDTGSSCTVCDDGNIVDKEGRYGQFFACSNYPSCKSIFIKGDDDKFTLKVKAVAKKTGNKCQKCDKGDIVEREGKFGAFYACDKYPKCKTIYIQDDKGGFSVKGWSKKAAWKKPDADADVDADDDMDTPF